MKKSSPRSFSCKDEELPVICRYSVISLKRDLTDFTTYSPKFNEQYVIDYEVRITAVEELVSPKSETSEMKKITERIFANMNLLLNDINHLGGYLEMANESIQLSAADFGLSDLRIGINDRDPEKVIDRLKDVNQKVVKYKMPLAEQGFSDALQERLANAYKTLNSDRQLQYSILSNRKAMVQNNIGMLNDLYGQLNEILMIGKILYQRTNPVKGKEYVFAELKKGVRRNTKTKDEPTDEQTTKPEGE